MLNEPLVSIITPCYNGEKFLPNFFQSLISQDYSNVEFIFVNDGSTDKSEDIFIKFKPKLEEKGWNVLYFKQNNIGAAGAINIGLKIFQGKYLTWPDSDDILYPNYISKKVDYMEKHVDCALLFCSCDIVDSEKKVIGKLKFNTQVLNQTNLFENFVYARNVYYAPIGSFVRSESFIKSVPNRKIYNNGHGQNWQMLLPIVYCYKNNIDFIDDVLACYVEHLDSHSHNKFTKYKRFLAYEDILINTINSMDMLIKEKKFWKRKIKNHYLKLRLRYKIKFLIKFCFGEKFFTFLSKIKNGNK